MATPPLDPSAVTAALARLPGWKVEGGALAREFTLKDFREAFAFMTRVAFEAEAMDHHPDWTNVYRQVTIRLSTHDAGGRITAKDVELAGRIQRLAGNAAD